MVTIMLSALCTLMVVGAFAAGLLIGIRLNNKPVGAAPTCSAVEMSPEELEMIETKRKMQRAEDEAFTKMINYNPSMVYNIHSEPRPKF